MNRGTDETSENKKLEQAKRSVARKNMDEQEVKETIRRFLEFLTYRQIAEIPFTVNNRVRRFSISQISNIVKKQDNPLDEKEELDEGSLASKAFQLFEEDKGPVQAVIELKISPEDAEEHYAKWVELKEKDLSGPNVPKRLKELESTVKTLFDTQSFSLINPLIGCGNPDCSARDENEMWVEVVCKACGKKQEMPLNMENKDEI